jgi:hypothetical protein
MLALAVIAQYHPENGFLCFYATSSQASICLVLLLLVCYFGIPKQSS